ncbi:hypothetical protein DYBT9623_04515 [Dyadobacter sp. CECT 9623]|uniref:Beta-lactamase n=1 Tax=Dyadobacter linearis TaxID=2823330 RepID=A0ABM8UVZ5_9BACT|nr:hypothetical protein [Dyadobacter sp. CECT 9623]CAG5072983.1 hypothetical protein DYBT9623_04515 [Dyadobacter sp. CECT 9623]
MKTQLLKSVSACLIVSTVLFSTSCKEDQILQESQVEQNIRDDSNAKLLGTKLDKFVFAQKIEDYLYNVGFGYSIYVEGEEIFKGNGGEGFARKGFEVGGAKPHGASVRQETLAATQFVTALAVLKTLRKYNISVKAKVWPYLPKGWVPSQKFKSLSFEQLLAHKTGLSNVFAPNKIKLVVEGKIDNAPLIGNADINYSLLGIITPFVEAVELSKKGNATRLNLLNKVPMAFNTYANAFGEIVLANVFVPAGLPYANRVSWSAWNESGPINASLATQGYPALKGDAPGLDKAEVVAHAGATGLYLSASEFAKIQSAASQFKIVSSDDLKLMKDSLLGFTGKINGGAGTYYYKTDSGLNCETMIMDFGKVQVCILANSTQNDFVQNPAAIAKLFDQSLH